MTGSAREAGTTGRQDPSLVDPGTLPEPGDRTVALRVHPGAERAIRDGHPWVFASSVVSSSHPPEPGDVVVVFDRKNRFLAAGLHDPTGPIRARLLVHGEPEEIGPELYRSRVAAALRLRRDVVSGETTGFRVLNGANDGMPGLVADLYDRTLVLQVHTLAWWPHLGDVLAVVRELLAPERVLLLSSRRVAEATDAPPPLASGCVLVGPAPDDGVPFLETGLRFEAHPFQGQKTGFYLDQRENRKHLASLSRGKRVLDVFSYTGAFGLHAARGGATEVVDVDGAGPALAQARRHHHLNRGDPAVAGCRHRTVQGDAFQVMEAMAGDSEAFDIVVLDPPSFTRSARHRDRALRAYRGLTTLALPLLRLGGLLVQASCSAWVEADAFHDAVHRAARGAGRPLRELERTGHPPDHPVTFPEGRYLKCLWARAP